MHFNNELYRVSSCFEYTLIVKALTTESCVITLQCNDNTHDHVEQ